MVGLRNAALSEKLQMYSAHTLEKAMVEACQSEAIKKQQSLLHSDFQETSRESVEYLEGRKLFKSQGRVDLIKLISMFLLLTSPPSHPNATGVAKAPYIADNSAQLQKKSATNVVKRDTSKPCVGLGPV